MSSTANHALALAQILQNFMIDRNVDAVSVYDKEHANYTPVEVISPRSTMNIDNFHIIIFAINTIHRSE